MILSHLYLKQTNKQTKCLNYFASKCAHVDTKAVKPQLHLYLGILGIFVIWVQSCWRGILTTSIQNRPCHGVHWPDHMLIIIKVFRLSHPGPVVSPAHTLCLLHTCRYWSLVTENEWSVSQYYFDASSLLPLGYTSQPLMLHQLASAETFPWRSSCC